MKKNLAPFRKGNLMYLDLDFAHSLREELEKVIPSKVRKKEKVLDELLTAFGVCVDTHRKERKEGRGIIIGRDVQEFTPKPEPKKKRVSKKKRR